MAEIVNYRDHEEDTVGWAISELLKELGNRSKEQIFEKLPGKNFSIEVKINGHEVQFTTLIKAIDKQIDRLTLNRSKTMFKTAINKCQDEVANIFNSMLNEL